MLELIDNCSRVEEDHITSTVFTIMEERINNSKVEGLKIQAKQFQGRGNNSDESVSGADGALFLHVKLHNTEFEKFVLLQAKRFKTKSAKFDKRAVAQKDRMLLWTPDSFFLVYGHNGFQFASAFAVGLNDKLTELPTKNFPEFLKDHFNCFIGDHLWRFCPFFDKRRDYEKLAKHNLSIQIESSD